MLEFSLSSIGMLNRLDQSIGQTDASFTGLLRLDDRVFPHGVRLPPEKKQGTGLQRNVFLHLALVVFQSKNSLSTEGESENTGPVEEISRFVKVKSNVIAIVYRETNVFPSACSLRSSLPRY